MDWLLKVIASSQPDDETEDLVGPMGWGFTRQQAHFLRTLIAKGKAGISYERLVWELSCNDEPGSKETVRVAEAPPCHRETKG